MTSFVRNVVSHLMITMTTKNVGLRDKMKVKTIEIGGKKRQILVYDTEIDLNSGMTANDYRLAIEQEDNKNKKLVNKFKKQDGWLW